MRSDYQSSVNENFHVQNTQGVQINAKSDDRLKENYTNKDQNWSTGTMSGDIYISVPDDTHNLIVNHHNDPNNPEHFLPEGRYPGTSVFFTDESTASKHFTDDGKFDSVGLCRENQQSPYFNEEAALNAKLEGRTYYPEYNGHLDCFRVNSEKMQEHFGTTDFYAAMSHCTANTALGEGGGWQGYNPYINEMINKGALEYIPQNSRTCDFNECKDYYERRAQFQEEAKAVNDYINNNNIVAKDGERLGYNEIARSNAVSANNNNTSSASITSQNVASTTGGGSQAPPITAADSKPQANSEDKPRGKVDTDHTGGFADFSVPPANNSTDPTQGMGKSNNGFNM